MNVAPYIYVIGLLNIQQNNKHLGINSFVIDFFLPLVYKMENIIIEFSEKNETDMWNDVCAQFELDIPDDSMVINVKYNFELEEEETYEEASRSFPLYDIQSYIKTLGCQILFSSVGVHLNGRSKNPHLHYHFIVTPFHFPSNPPQYRQRWAKKTDLLLEFLDATWKFYHKIDLSTPKYSTLAYPLKEGNEIKIHRNLVYIYDQRPMNQSRITFLKSVGSAIYQRELALNLRKDKCEERQKKALLNLGQICKDNKHLYNTYKEMCVWLEDNYLATLSLEDKPDFANYNKNCQKIGNHLKLFRYCDRM